ncbi:beta-ketoacyl synthase N-terminal-like domain-containing protein [Streptomyces sp. NRRL S-87]|uniref:beta-ketoacyl synthase N-terminal-like domain-containing protein n=1 Tax=Streptomyces sp. NRRL S-87 TaxID=1463920 RepID=UPI0004BE6D4A|nr:beta-ketoacyl synthase N-terminal-like domain-containing protein [Streptomyces sp. NRRL S-87]
MNGSVALTGIGLTCALGEGLDAVWEGLLAGRTPFADRAAPGELYPGAARSRAAALADDLPDVPAFGRRRLRALSRESLLASRVALLAWQDAGLDPAGAGAGGADPHPWAAEDVGVVLGTAAGGLTGYLQVLHDGLTLGPELVSPYQGPQGSLNAAVSDLCIAAGAQGPVLTLTAGRCAGAHALTVAADWLRTGQARAVLVAAVDVLDPVRLAAGRSTGDPAPFAAGRAGALPGEAAVVFVVEDAARARARGARVHAEVTGLEALRGTDVAGTAHRAIGRAVAATGPGGERIGLVVSSACGDEATDRDEALALAAATTGGTPVFSPFGALGDCAGGTALLQVALAAKALTEGRTPPTPGLDGWDPRLPELAVGGAHPPGDGPALVLTTDVQGHASAVLVRAPRP